MAGQSTVVSRREFAKAGIVGIASTGTSDVGRRSKRGDAQDRAHTDLQPTSVKALVFDVFGTVVDWRTSVAREVA